MFFLSLRVIEARIGGQTKQNISLVNYVFGVCIISKIYEHCVLPRHVSKLTVAAAEVESAF